MLSSIGRAAIRRVGAGPSPVASVRVGVWTWQAQRVCFALSPYDATKIHSRHESRFAHSLRRSYATTAKATPKPRASKTTTGGKPAITKKSSQGRSRKAAAKPKAKPKKKVAAKRGKKVLTEAQKAKRAQVKARTELRELKATALLSGPKQLPNSAWSVLVAEELANAKPDMGGVQKVMADTGARYKNLGPSERENLNHIANQNKLANQAAFKAWVESHTPEQIQAANLARRKLKRKIGKKGSSKFSPIEDARLPKRTVPPYAIFVAERWASGDMKGISSVDAMKAIGEEWKTLSAAEKKRFEDGAAAEKTRYMQEYQTAFHRDPPAHSKAAAAA